MKITTNIVRGPIDELFLPSQNIYLPSYQEIKNVLIDYQRMAVTRSSQRWSFADLQIHLFLSMQNEQLFISKTKENLEKVENENIRKQVNDIVQLPLFALRRIADGIAFRFLEYDVSLMQALCLNVNGVSDLSSNGIMHEVEYFGAITDYNKNNAQTLLCCLSDIMGIGDVLLKSSEEFEIVEVKQGKYTRGSRISRQKNRMESIKDFYLSKKQEIDGNAIELIEAPSRIHNLRKLAEGFTNCSINNPYYFQTSDFQIVFCFDFCTSSNEEMLEMICESEENAKQILGSNVIDISSYKFKSRLGVTIPITVFPLSEHIIADILLGGLVYISYISPSLLSKYIEKRGWDVIDISKSTKENNTFGSPVFLAVNKDNREVNFTIPVDLYIDCGVCLFDIDSILEGYELTTQKKGMYTLCYQDEHNLWL
jgi:hypothetical protein